MNQPYAYPYSSRPTKVIHVGGSGAEIGRGHGEALADEARDGMVKIYSDLWRRIWEAPAEAGAGKLVRALASRGVEKFFVEKLIRNLPEAAVQRVTAMVATLGADPRAYLTALALPDLLPMLQAYLARFYPRLFVAPREVPLFGCSSFVAKGQNFLIGRNLDFPGVGYWDRFPVLQVTAPRGGLRSVAITSAGVPFGGISGVNEAQISVHLHQHYGVRTDLRGVLPFVVAEEILATARSLEDALRVLEKSRLASSWAFILADGREQTACIVEAFPGRSGVRRLSERVGYLTHSNFFQSAECASTGYATTERMNWDNSCRNGRLAQLLAREVGELAPARAVQMISDGVDPYLEIEKPVNRTVSQLYNIQSYVLDPVAMRLWLAEGDAPIHLRSFREYDLGELFAGRSGNSGRTLPGYQYQNANVARAKELYTQGFVLAFEGNESGAAAFNEAALSAHFTAEMAQVGALLALKSGDANRAAALLGAARDSAKLVSEQRRRSLPPEYFEATLWLARVCLLQSKRVEAERLFDEVQHSTDCRDENLRRIASRKRSYEWRAARAIFAPYSSYVPFL